MAAHSDAWTAGLDEEIEFWARWLRDRGDPWADDYKWRIDPATMLQPRITELLPPRGRRVRILDVGSGPLTILGKRIPGRDVTITAVDPLADRYGELFDRFGLDPVVRPVPGEAERLGDVFPANTFDLVFARNCLDHGYDPLDAIRQMLRVVKPGCVVVLDHAVNEGEYMNYAGPHQWNFTAEDGRFVIWQPGLRIDAHSELERDAEVWAGIADDTSRYMGVTLRKRRDQAWRRVIRRRRA